MNRWGYLSTPLPVSCDIGRVLECPRAKLSTPIALFDLPPSTNTLEKVSIEKSSLSGNLTFFSWSFRDVLMNPTNREKWSVNGNCTPYHASSMVEMLEHQKAAFNSLRERYGTGGEGKPSSKNRSQ
jgi:hypothetical protein